jgi:murein L,D-transpeptidase YafK
MGLALTGREIPSYAMMHTQKYLSRNPRVVVMFVSLCLIALTGVPLVPQTLPSSANGEELPQLQLIPDSLIGLSSENGPAYAIVVEKETQTLTLYQFNGTFALKYRFPCSTGEVAGEKLVSGDQKTPEGVYFFTKQFSKKHLAPIYGSGAFVMDYPNFMDQKYERSGNSIWLHGSDKPIKPRDSNGCVVLNNDDLNVLARHIKLNRTPIVVVKKINLVSPPAQLPTKKGIADFLGAWKEALVNGDLDKFIACYSEPHGDPDVIEKAWNHIQTARQRTQVPLNVNFENMSLLKGNSDIVVLFDQVMHLDRRVTPVGTKKLFLEKQDKAWKILQEEYQPLDPRFGGTTPLIAALNDLERLFADRVVLAELVSEWVDAWSSKDIERYRSFYAPDFHGGGLDLETWIRNKKRLNRLYDSIHVSIEGLSIKLEGDKSTLTFLQRYNATGYQAVGMKHLEMKRIGGKWKIRQEYWEKIEE